MTDEQLTAYLQDDSYLYAVSYEELKTLVMQYPYATNLRILLLKKSFLEQNKDYDRNLQMAATFTTNRKYLYQVVQKVKSFKSAPQSVILGEDFLELTELSNIEKLLAEKQVADALGGDAQFDTLAADWQLEFGNLETAEEAATTPKIKGRDEEDIDMFELAFNAEIAENQAFTNEEDLDYLIENLVSEFENPSVETAFEDEKTDAQSLENVGETAEEITQDTLDLSNAFTAPLVEKPAYSSVNFFELIGEKPQNSVIETEENTTEMGDEMDVDPLELTTKTNDTPLELTSETSGDAVNAAEESNTDKVEITEEEMDEFLSNSFKSIQKAETDDLMTHSFAVLKGDTVEESDNDFAYSFIDAEELMPKNSLSDDDEITTKSVINSLGNDDEINEELSVNELTLIEAEFDKALTNNALDNNGTSMAPPDFVEQDKPITTIEPITKKVAVKESSELESANKAAIKLEKEITKEAPSHSFRVIKKEIAREVATNSFTIVVKDKTTEDTQNTANQLIANAKLINANDLINTNELVDTNDLIENLDMGNTPQYVMDLEDIIPVFKQKTENEENNFEKKKEAENRKKTPQYKDELDDILASFNKKTNDTDTMMTAKKSDLELEISNENKVKIAAKSTTDRPTEGMSFTEWLRQYRMNQAAAAAQIAAYETTLKETATPAEVFDNQLFIEKEANRKSIKQNLDALFETDNEVPENLFGLIEPTEKQVEKSLDTEGAVDMIRQHLNTESGDKEFAYSGEKKKKKKKKEMHELAARSIAEDAEMISETLADLLVWQGKTAKAIDMYQKLSLAFPDKRTYFADKIETIKSNAA